MASQMYRHLLPFAAMAVAAMATHPFAENELPESARVDYQSYLADPRRNTQDSNQRTLAASDIFMGKPYAFDSLGDSSLDLFDPRPLYNTDAFDCMTFVSTVLAMVESYSLESLLTGLVRIRYGPNLPAYFNRHHFISTQWNPSNTKLGFLEDVTTTILSAEDTSLALVNEDVIDMPNWLQHQKRQFEKQKMFSPEQQAVWQQTYQHASLETARISYIPLDAFFDVNDQIRSYILDQIPAASVIEFVTPHWDLTASIGTHLDIMHLGLVVKREGRLYFRHAKIRGSVVELPLEDYLRFLRLHVPRAQGVHIEKILLTT